jgi:DNA-binding response OmpR family regulator
MRVLVVEDDARISEDVCKALRAAGFIVDATTDGEDAWFRGDT